MSAHHCDTCSWRARYDARPRSFAGRLWRWHIRFCPGWRSYYRSRPAEERRRLRQAYGLPPEPET